MPVISAGTEGIFRDALIYMERKGITSLPETGRRPLEVIGPNGPVELRVRRPTGDDRWIDVITPGAGPAGTHESFNLSPKGDVFTSASSPQDDFTDVITDAARQLAKRLPLNTSQETKAVLRQLAEKGETFPPAGEPHLQIHTSDDRTLAGIFNTTGNRSPEHPLVLSASDPAGVTGSHRYFYVSNDGDVFAGAMNPEDGVTQAGLVDQFAQAAKERL